MKFCLFFIPFWLPIVLLLTRRVSILGASAVASGAAAVLYCVMAEPTLEGAGLELLKGVWLAVPIVSVILAGLLFHSLLTRFWIVRSVRPDANSSSEGLRSVVFAACFLIGPFTEAATGFGVGLVIALGILLRAGVPPRQALLFSLFSQVLVVWGAFAVGTMLGATLADIGSPRDLGWRSAVLMTPIMFLWLILYWRICRAADIRGTAGQLSKEALWVAGICAALLFFSKHLDPDVIGIVVLGCAAALHGLAPGGPGLRSKLVSAAPYIALCASLILARLWMPFNQVLSNVTWRPFSDAPAWLPLLSPAFWLCLVGLFFSLLKADARGVRDVLLATWRRARVAAAVTLLFVVCARFMIAGDVPGVLASELQAQVGAAAAVVFSPILAAVAGFLTASNAASNSLLMPSVAALAQAGGWDVAWIAAVQNVTGSALSMLSPVRIVMGCAVAALGAGIMSDVYRRAWPLGLAPVLIMMLAALMLIQ
ncbi:L-lactate permease [Achromobacter spanius]|uniref:L-lactate permease n=1 Tax=Achromobacter spanius TaxID=217203 RepID=UPI0037F85EAD